MKKTMQSILVLALTILLAVGCTACKPAAEPTPTLWDTATYQTDTELGDGSKTVKVEVAAADKTITFTLHTEQDTVGGALLENNLVAGDQSEYGLYIKAVNGIKADYDTDGAYWAFYENGQYAMAGADTTTIDPSVTYQLAYTKG